MQFDGGLTVTQEMRRILSQPGTLSGDAGQRFRELYSDGLDLTFMQSAFFEMHALL